jgi:hypothetical protein
MFRLIDGERGDPGLGEQAQNLLQVAPERWGQLDGLGLIFSGGFRAANVPRRRPKEPHRAGAIAAQVNDAAPDQNIGAGLPEQAARFLFGFFLIRLVRVHRAIDP